MYHYLFTNDTRIKNLNSLLVKAGNDFLNNTIPTDKSENNNTMTLGFYFNLTSDSNCSRLCASGDVKTVVLNFIKMFQFPNPRTSDSLEEALNDGITLAPLRVIIQVLYFMKTVCPDDAYLTREEIRDFIFYNNAVAKDTNYDVLKLIKQIQTFRETGSYPATVEKNPSNRIWKQEERQIREMIKILNWSGCTAETSDGRIFIDQDDLSNENKATIFDILNTRSIWIPNALDDFKAAKKDYQLYFDIKELSIFELKEKPAEGELEPEVGSEEEFTPEWFEAKASEFPTLDQEAKDYLNRFFARFSIDKLAALSGKDILDEIFLNNNNKSNLCYVLEFDSECRRIFGGIKSGTAYKYGLHYSKKNGSWATGSGQKPAFISEDEAIDLGTQIRDSLVAGAELIAEKGEMESEDDYLELYNNLVDVTDGYVNRVWFLKYYAMMFPSLFPVFYSHSAQMNVIHKLKLDAKNNPISRMGEIAGFVRKCNISNVMFGRIFGTYCYGDDIDVEELDSDGENMKNCLEIIRPARSKKVFPLNAIIYGAPGTGKTYSTAEYALAIIEQREVDLTFKTPEERKKVMESYNNYVRSGQVVFTTFHQNYGYEEFVQGLRPDVQSEEMSFKVVDGVFKRIADMALNEPDPSKNYVIIIDEINRANISKVLGELITLIEEDKRWGEMNQTCATLQSGDVFAVPNNLYILGTMNSADKSISLIDAALRRRFEFIEQKPITELVGDSELRNVFKKLNDTLAEELQSSDLLIGHSYFMGKTIEDLPKVMNNSIVPLLYEYFYDHKKKVMSVLKDVLKDTGYEPVDEVLGRVSVKKKEQ